MCVCGGVRGRQASQFRQGGHHGGVRGKGLGSGPVGGWVGVTLPAATVADADASADAWQVGGGGVACCALRVH